MGLMRLVCGNALLATLDVAPKEGAIPLIPIYDDLDITFKFCISML